MYVELFWVVMCLVMVYYASWVSISFFTVSIIIILIDARVSASDVEFGNAQHRDEVTRSLLTSLYASIGLLGYLLVIVFSKLYVAYNIVEAGENIIEVFDKETDVSWGLWLNTCQTYESCTVQPDSELDWLKSFTFEMVTFVLLLLNLLATRGIQKMRKDGADSQSFLGANFFINQNGVLKLLLVPFLLAEIFLVPNVLELPAMILICFYCCLLLIPEHKAEQKDMFRPAEDGDSCGCTRCRVKRWSQKDSRLLQYTF